MKRVGVGLLVVCMGLSLAAGQARAQFNIPGLEADAKKIALFELRGQLLEKPQDQGFFLGDEPPLSLKDLLDRIVQAREDDDVKAIVLMFEGALMGVAQLEELRLAIGQTRDSGKDVIVRLEEAPTGLYALSSAASRISMVPTGDLWLTGLYGESPYLKNMLDKIGVQADFEHMGAYKSAAEPLTRTGPTKESEEMTNWLLDSLYNSLVGMIAEGRQMKPEKVRALIDDGPYTAERAKEVGLIDAVEPHDEFVAHLKKRYGQETKIARRYGDAKEEEIPTDFFGAMQYMMKLFMGGEEETHGDSVAVVYVEGPITTGKSPQGLFGGEAGAGSTSIRRALEKAASDESVKAVVLRVDSPGGSALASDIIWRATQEVAKDKPFVVSMGNVAGSGGYYVSCGARQIFADATTITASIGVVGGKLVTTGLWDWMGVNWSPHQRGKNAAMLNSSRPFNDEERKRFINWMDDIYGVFKSRVTAGRGKKLTKPIDELAGGRVFTGEQALKLGLVDKIGGMEDAIRYAAAQANLTDYEVRVIPKPKTIFDMLSEAFGGQSQEQEVSTSLTGSLLKRDSALMQQIVPMLNQLDPQRVQAVWRTLMRLDLIHREGVITMMPEEIVIR